MLDEVLPRSWPIASSQPMPLLLQHHFFFPWPSYSDSESISESWCWNDAISMGFPSEENAQVCGNMMILSNLTCCVQSLSGWPCAQPPGTGPTCHVSTSRSMEHLLVWFILFPGATISLQEKQEGSLPPFFQFLMPAAQSYLMINANGKEVPKSKDRLTIHATPLPRSIVGGPKSASASTTIQFFNDEWLHGNMTAENASSKADAHSRLWEKPS